MTRKIFIALFMALSLVPFASHADGPTVAASHVWIRAAPPGVKVMAGYLTLENLSDQTLTLIGFTSPDFGSVMVRNSLQKGVTDSMAPVTNLAIPPHKSIVFAPGEYRLMLMQPIKQLYEGDLVTLILAFSDHSSLIIMAPVRHDNPQH